MSTPNTHFGAKRISELLENCKSIYFIGIGGINMSSLAHISQNRGFRVGGSDRVSSALTERLAARGIEIYHEHRAENVWGYDAVVYTVAISPDNPEYLEAQKMGIPCISRADFLGYIMTGYPRRVGVSGMHGKSTCTSMCASVFMGANSSPTVLSGAEMDIMDGAYTVGEGDDFIFEACEYMDSFLDFNPTVAVILNIELDHVDYFHGIEQVRGSFARYASLTGDGGYVVANADDENVMISLENYGGTVLRFGVDSENADFRAVNIACSGGRYSFDIEKRGKPLCRVELSVTGYHNIYNALACAAAADLCGIRAEDIAAGLAAFGGAKRRMEYKGRICGADIYDDYGHHPTEIATTLAGARGLAEGRLVCVYQPHTYSRTKALFDDFARAFEAADKVIFSDIYAAREIDDGSVSSKMLAEAVGEKAVWGGDLKMTAELLRAELKDGDTAIVMGAGDIWKIVDMVKQGRTF
ncbi:MAG: UDP-N-acetylmuramate--L-alanine ligase [Ruminococcaceae bacterium]|nr:UDP-N-acetylmuramate--L-alanine ligase [Oscillospiraceae bacterium]